MFQAGQQADGVRYLGPMSSEFVRSGQGAPQNRLCVLTAVHRPRQDLGQQRAGTSPEETDQRLLNRARVSGVRQGPRGLISSVLNRPITDSARALS